MQYSSSIRKNVLPVALLPLLLFALESCSGGLEIRKVDLPPNMVPFNDASKKLHFMVPSGWQKASVEPVIEKNTEGIRWAEPVGFRKGEKGTLAVWCDLYNAKNRGDIVHLFDVRDAYAPIHKFKFAFEIEAPGTGYLSRVAVYGYTATHAVKGEKKEFLIIMGMKSPTMTKMHKECEYMLLGRSTSSDYNEEIEANILAVAATLNNSGEYK